MKTPIPFAVPRFVEANLFVKRFQIGPAFEIGKNKDAPRMQRLSVGVRRVRRRPAAVVRVGVTRHRDRNRG